MIRIVGDMGNGLQEGLSPEAMERLMAVPAFRERYEAAFAEGVAQAEAHGRIETLRENLLQYFRIRRDDLTAHAQVAVVDCTDQAILQGWCGRAYAGETSKQIFG